MSHEHRDASDEEEISVNPMFARSGETKIPRWRIPEGEMLPDSAYQIIHDEILLDGNARQNLATFVTTWMEPQASQLYAEAFDKNMIDRDEYPQTAAIEERCVHILADLWNSPEPHTTIGTSTIGSSEACMLAGLAFKRRWEKRRRDEGKDVASPNMVVSASVQVVWEKFAAYWDVEPRYVPVSKEHPNLSPEGMLEAVDDHTICVVAILGVTYTGDVRAREGARRSRSTISTRGRGSTCPCTSTAPPARSSPRSWTRSSNGTSACPACTRSTRRATSSGWSTRASAGWSGPSANTCRTS